MRCVAYPVLQVFVESGNEAETLSELDRVADALLWIKDLRVIVVLVLDRSVSWRAASGLVSLSTDHQCRYAKTAVTCNCALHDCCVTDPIPI